MRKWSAWPGSTVSQPQSSVWASHLPLHCLDPDTEVNEPLCGPLVTSWNSTNIWWYASLMSQWHWCDKLLQVLRSLSAPSEVCIVIWLLKAGMVEPEMLKTCLQKQIYTQRKNCWKRCFPYGPCSGSITIACRWISPVMSNLWAHYHPARTWTRK